MRRSPDPGKSSEKEVAGLRPRAEAVVRNPPTTAVKHTRLKGTVEGDSLGRSLWPHLDFVWARSSVSRPRAKMCDGRQADRATQNLTISVSYSAAPRDPGQHLQPRRTTAAAILTMMPELGQLDPKQAAHLAGLAGQGAGRGKRLSRADAPFPTGFHHARRRGPPPQLRPRGQVRPTHRLRKPAQARHHRRHAKPIALVTPGSGTIATGNQRRLT